MQILWTLVNNGNLNTTGKIKYMKLTKLHYVEQHNSHMNILENNHISHNEVW